MQVRENLSNRNKEWTYIKAFVVILRNKIKEKNIITQQISKMIRLESTIVTYII